MASVGRTKAASRTSNNRFTRDVLCADDTLAYVGYGVGSLKVGLVVRLYRSRSTR